MLNCKDPKHYQKAYEDVLNRLEKKEEEKKQREEVNQGL
jgi:hypothetical protein